MHEKKIPYYPSAPLVKAYVMYIFVTISKCSISFAISGAKIDTTAEVFMSVILKPQFQLQVDSLTGPFPLSD